MSVIATLAGIPLAAEQEFSWPLSEGTRPQQRTFETDAAGAAAIMAKAGQPVKFVIASPGHPRLQADGVHILSSRPGSRPETAAILVADCRWLLPHRLVARDFNLRRRTGETRLVGEGNVRVENQAVAADVAYAPWSLNNGVPWTPMEALRSVLEELAPGNFRIGQFTRSIAIEDLSLAHPGDVALDVILAYCGGLGITVDIDGRLVVYDKRGGGEVGELLGAGPPLQDAGYLGPVSRRYSRAFKTLVYFERRVELRFDFDEDAPLASGVRSPIPARRIENVMPCPDTTLVMSGKTITQGTLRTIDQYIEAWRGLAPAFSNGPLSQGMIRRYYVGMASMLYTRFGGVQGFEEPRWTRRISYVLKHWRKTFRIRPEWRDAIRGLVAERVAVIDPETRTPGKALAWLDYISVPSMMPMVESFFGRPVSNPDIGRQVPGYPTGAALSTGTASPAIVSIPDDQAGVIRVDLAADRDGEAERMIPGNADGLPKAKCVDTRQIGNFKATLADVTLNAGFKLAVVVSAIQASPNNLGRYHVEEVLPGDAETALGGKKIGACDGPAWHIFISAGVAPARFAWADQYATQIEQAFFNGGKYPDPLLVNKTQIRNIAIAEAARQYGTMLDRTEGSFAVPLNPGISVRGAISMVEHAINEDGVPFTRVSILPEIEPVDMHSLLPQSDQRKLRGMVDL